MISCDLKVSYYNIVPINIGNNMHFRVFIGAWQAAFTEEFKAKIHLMGKLGTCFIKQKSREKATLSFHDIFIKFQNKFRIKYFF